jgi:hypothetical protein
MGASLSIFVLLSLSIFVTRVAAVALRITGLDESSARFQSLSAFSGTGFTTRESESIVNYPIRRRIIMVLMILGNFGMVSVFATLVMSLVITEGDTDAVIRQVIWPLGGLLLLWVLILNKRADRIMCAFVARILESTTFLGKRSFHRLLQVSDGYSVCEHSVGQLISSQNAQRNYPTIALRREEHRHIWTPPLNQVLFRAFLGSNRSKRVPWGKARVNLQANWFTMALLTWHCWIAMPISLITGSSQRLNHCKLDSGFDGNIRYNQPLK